MSMRDDEAARAEDQMAAEQGKMAGGTNKGPTAAATADTQGAFGDAIGGAEGREKHGVPAGDPVDSTIPVADVGPKGE